MKQKANNSLTYFNLLHAIKAAGNVADDERIVTGHLKMHHQWAPQNAPPCVVDNLPFCL